MGKLDGKVAVITGGSSGIGLAAAETFVSEGAHVVIFSRRQSELDAAAERIGRNIATVQGDISVLPDLDRLYESVANAGLRIDILVASAGYVAHETIETATPEHFDITFNTNARGTFFTVQKALPLMNDGGSIILVSSALHLMGLPMCGTYSATKAAIRSFARTWASELASRRIRVNTLSPGAIETPIFSGQFRSAEEEVEGRKMYENLVPLKRIGRPEEMGRAILFLATDDSSFSTGIDLVADGGGTQV